MKAEILVVDDTPDNLRLLIEMLGAQGYKVRPASDGPYALSTARAAPPDLILLDIKMPGMDGYEVCEQLKTDECTRDIPIIFISALNEVFDKVKGFSIGAVDYITKPFQAKEVLARVETHLTVWRLQQHLQEQNTQLQQEIEKREEAEEELRVLNHQLKETNQQLQEANASKDKFFSIIAHDLRNPFNVLLSLTEMLIEEFDFYSKDKLKKRLSQLHSSSKKVYALVANLLEWSRLERGLMECEPQKLVLADIVEKNVRLFASVGEQKQIILRNLVPHGTTAHTDYKMIDTVMRNLISNALKFTPAGGTVEVSLQRQDETLVEIAIADTGIGMSQENIDTLFRIDKKSSRKGTANEEGSGLGLILCKELAEKNGGRIHVNSEVGKGSRFIVSLRKPGVPGGRTSEFG